VSRTTVAHATSYRLGKGIVSSGIKRPDREAAHLLYLQPPSRMSEVLASLTYRLTPSFMAYNCLFTACNITKHITAAKTRGAQSGKVIMQSQILAVAQFSIV
jgi:hypothetical protein